MPSPRTTAARRALALLCVLAAWTVAQPASAATPGVNVRDVPSADDIEQARALGAKMLRVFVLAGEMRESRARIAAYADASRAAAAAGMGIVFVVVEKNRRMDDPAAYASAVGALARQVARTNGSVAYEIWNEEDAADWWAPAPDPAAYVTLLSAASRAVRENDPAAKVILGPTTGNNYAWIEQLYASGLTGAMFDAAAVHTDTACLTAGPDSFYRQSGRLGQFTFLGYREVRATLLAHGDDKPIWMTELGWSSTQDTTRPLCRTGTFAGQKPSGVTEARQAEFLQSAYHCLALDSYVQVALWFTLRDDDSQSLDELRHYGLLRDDGTRKPSYGAFKAAAGAPGADLFPGAPCGDFDPPTVRIAAPVTGQQFVGSLLIQASASDAGVGLGRITFRVDGAAQELRNFTTGLANGKLVELDWQRARRLANGPHRITVEAVDKNGNVGSASLDVVKVRSLPATLPTTTRGWSVRCRGRRCAFRGRVWGPRGYSLGGKVQVLWQWRTSVRGGRAGRTRVVYKTIHKGLKQANQPFTFTQQLGRGGRWRVRARYLGEAPLRRSASRRLSFRVR